MRTNKPKVGDKLISSSDIIAEAKRLSASSAHDTNPFPIEAFSKRTRQFITSVYDHLRFKKDYLGINILCAIGVAAGKRYRIEINNTFHDYPGLFYVMVGYPSIGKTPPMRLILKPLFDYNREISVKYNEELDAFYQRLEKYENSKDKEKMEKPRKPRKPHFITQDYTLEWLVGALNRSMNGMLLFQDEISGWTKSSMRYSKGMDESTFWNERYNHSDIIYNRKSEDYNIVVNEPLISVIGGTQIEQLKHLIDGDKTENGFMSRLLFAYPTDQLLELSDNDDVPEDEIHWWNGFIREIIDLDVILDDKKTTVIPRTIRLSSEAKRIFMSWKKDNINMINEMNSSGNGVLASYFGKLGTALGRLCLIIQIERWRNRETDMEQIDAESVERAILLVEYFRKVFHRIYFYFFVKGDIRLSELERKVYSALPDEFETCQGKEIAVALGMPERTFSRFISDNTKLFSKQKHGIYHRIFSL